MINTVDSWFQDASLDAWKPAHKGKGPGGGQFTSGPGGGGSAAAKPDRGASRRAEHLRGHTGARHTRTVTAHKEKGQGAAAAVAAAVSRLSQHAQHEAGEVARETTGAHGGVELLTKGFDEPNTPLRRKIGQALSNVPGVVWNQLKEEKNHFQAAGNTLVNIARGLPMAPEDNKALKWMARKAVTTTIKWATGISLVPGLGMALEHVMGPAEDWLMGQIAEHVAHHAIEEHTTKLLGTSGRAAARGYFTNQQRQEATQMGGGDDHAYYDAEPSDDECEQAVRAFLKTVGESVNTAPIPMQNLMKQYKTLQLQQQQTKESDKSSPMFGGIGGNALKLPTGDEGTSEGAKKGWQHRHRGTAPLSSAGSAPQLQRTASHGYSASLKKQGHELRKTETPEPAKTPSFEEMHKKAQEFPEPPPPRKRSRGVPKKGTQQPTNRERERHSEAAQEVGMRSSTGFMGMGERRSEKTKGSIVGALPTRTNISMKQKEREGPGVEQREVTARKHRAEINELTRKESRTAQEQKRLDTLVRIHGASQSQPVGTQQQWVPKKEHVPGGGLRSIRRR